MDPLLEFYNFDLNPSVFSSRFSAGVARDGSCASISPVRQSRFVDAMIDQVVHDSKRPVIGEIQVGGRGSLIVRMTT
jgi:hypothetical protein